MSHAVSRETISREIRFGMLMGLFTQPVTLVTFGRKGNKAFPVQSSCKIQTLQ